MNNIVFKTLISILKLRHLRGYSPEYFRKVIINVYESYAVEEMFKFFYAFKTYILGKQLIFFIIFIKAKTKVMDSINRCL